MEFLFLTHIQDSIYSVKGYSMLVLLLLLSSSSYAMSLILVPEKYRSYKASWEMFPLLAFSRKVSIELVFSSLNVWWNSFMKPSGPGVLSLGMF